MSVTKSYKTLTFSGAEGFAVVRALRGRIEALTAQQAAIIAAGDKSPVKYLEDQLAATHDALALFRNTPYLVSQAEGVTIIDGYTGKRTLVAAKGAAA